MKKSIDLKNGYSMEMSNISKKLNQLEKGRVTEVSGRAADGTLEKNARELKGLLADLFLKIEGGKKSSAQEMGEVISRMMKGG